MSVPSPVIIWCDVSFETDGSYQSMKDEFNEITTGTPKQDPDAMDVSILNEEMREFHSNNVPLVFVRTIDDATKKINEHINDKVFIICSGTIGRALVPIIAQKHLTVHDIYIYTHDFALHADWAMMYVQMIKMFDFHTSLLIRLTHDISKWHIEQGKSYLQLNDSISALKYFQQAHKLETAANKRGETDWNLPGTATRLHPTAFLTYLKQLEGEHGLIAQAENAIRARGLPVQNS
ncbi:unnamed protein product [Adineta ricciae]|uniref:Uncharacterized protein n=1 Tax=Adineta ricciae TaxID=249248 RepID=A0A815GK16_ADIRI|nr:unnamed protein product [Adineta ricciae]CAF1631275.1 unnamed protein product [Adineta ricciae]